MMQRDQATLALTLVGVLTSKALMLQPTSTMTSSVAPESQMHSVEHFRMAYSRTGSADSEPDASRRFPLASHGTMASAYDRVKALSAGLLHELELVDRNHTVSSLL